jgi:hypothetical protein
MTYSLSIRSVYNFTLKAGAILGYGYKDATVLALLDYDSAKAIEDVTPVHVQVYSQLGPGVPRSASDLTYVKIRTSTGEVRVLAMDWIAEQPVLVVKTTASVIVADIHLSDLDKLRQVLLQNGFTSITISTID